MGTGSGEGPSSLERAGATSVMARRAPRKKGDIEFGVDGNMWITAGEGGSAWAGTSGNLGCLLGSMAQLALGGKAPAEGNPCADDAMLSDACNNAAGAPPANLPIGAKCLKIWAAGLRNPSLLAIDASTQGQV